MAETISDSHHECVHARQRQVNGVWVCRLCKAEIHGEATAAKDFGSIRFGGLDAFRQFRALGQTEREMTQDNIARFRKEKGYDPVREGERWI